MSKLTKLLRNPQGFIKDSRFVKNYIAVKKELVSNDSDYDVVVYFFGNLSHSYQIEQWFPVFEKLSRCCKFCLLVRNKSVFDSFSARLETVYLKTIDELMSFYDENNVRCILYVNNKYKNFQSLITHRSLHVHINHGESDKASMHSNQSKAYDYVFCVGDAAIDRYKDSLLKFQRDKYIKVGRPQLDGVISYSLNLPRTVKKILYAPTWAATHESMNYSSVAEYGLKIAESIISSDDHFLIYKPHPSTGTTCHHEQMAHDFILNVVNESTNAMNAAEVDINTLFPVVDAAIFDNSSVTIDYLNYDKPFLSTNMYKCKKDIPAFVRGSRMLNEKDYDYIVDLLNNEIVNDSMKDSRSAMKHYYLGNYKDGEATKVFIEKVLDVANERDKFFKCTVR